MRLRSGFALPTPQATKHFLILIDGLSHLDCRAADRSGLRYPSDLTNAEWGLIRRLIPAAKRGGNKPTVNVREIVDGLMYLLGTGCQWVPLPKDLPPRSTVNLFQALGA